jgi:hypothetical protein
MDKNNNTNTKEFLVTIIKKPIKQIFWLSE